MLTIIYDFFIELKFVIMKIEDKLWVIVMNEHMKLVNIEAGRNFREMKPCEKF